MEEDHCFRAQAANLRSLKKKYGRNLQLDFEAESIETLLNIVSIHEGITILPELAIQSLSEERQKGIKKFTSPVPVREISLLTYKHFVKTNLLQVLSEEIQTAATPFLSEIEGKKNQSWNTIVDINNQEETKFVIKMYSF